MYELKSNQVALSLYPSKWAPIPVQCVVQSILKVMNGPYRTSCGSDCVKETIEPLDDLVYNQILQADLSL